MQRQMLKSEIHRATITDCDVEGVGSITLDPALMRQADMLVNENETVAVDSDPTVLLGGVSPEHEALL